MNNKIIRTGLIALVTVIWGIIGWKVVKHVSPPSTINPFTERLPAAPQKQEEKLLLNYRDPFLGEVKNVTPPKMPVKKPLPVEKPVIPEEPPLFRYKGTIIKEGKTFLLLEKQGTTSMQSAKEAPDGYRIIRLTADTLVLLKNKQQYILRLE